MVPEPRLASGTWVSALLRRASAAGDHGAVLRRGDPTAGAIILVARTRGGEERAYARVSGSDRTRWESSANGAEEVARYLAAQQRYDEDLWVVEVLTEDLARLVDETITVR